MGELIARSERLARRVRDAAKRRLRRLDGWGYRSIRRSSPDSSISQLASFFFDG